MKRVITTVGTSLISNYKDAGNKSIDGHKDYLDSECSKWNDRRNEQIKSSINEWMRDTENASAEIKSLIKIQGELQDLIAVYLLTTDTIASNICAELIKVYFDGNENLKICFNLGTDMIKGLQVNNSDLFVKDGLINLVERIKDLTDNHYEDVILNITGGYKALIPYMTIIGQIYNIPIYYIFEETDELIKIPQAPVDFDFSVIDENYVAFNALRKPKIENMPTIGDFKADLAEKAQEKESEFNRLKKENLIEEIDGKVRMTPLGSLLMKRYKDLFDSGEYHKQNLISNLIELKLFKYYVKKYGTTVEHGRKVGDKGYDIDCYLEDEQKITAIEVKSGGNVPFWEAKKKEESIEYKVTKGGFKYLLDRTEKKRLQLKVYLYSTKPIHKRVIKQIRELHQKHPQETELLKWYWLKIDNKYATNTHWDIDNSDINEIMEVKNYV
jgi:putative CRISPR-associated protein (TIGR02619 family)